MQAMLLTWRRQPLQLSTSMLKTRFKRCAQVMALRGRAVGMTIEWHGRGVYAQGVDHTDLITASSKEVDLRDKQATNSFIERMYLEYVFIAAAKAGGILANDKFSGQFIYDDLMIRTNLIHASYKVGVRKLLFVGSTCIYPRHASQPISESELLAGPLKPTNDRSIVGYDGNITHDLGKPDGIARKLVDVSRIFQLGWRPTTSLENGIRESYAWFQKRYVQGLERTPEVRQ